jgi:hypothetical protein
MIFALIHPAIDNFLAKNYVHGCQEVQKVIENQVENVYKITIILSNL